MRHNIHQLLLVMGIANPRTHPSALQMQRNTFCSFVLITHCSLLIAHRSLLLRNNLRRIDLHHLADMDADDDEGNQGDDGHGEGDGLYG